MLGSSPETSAYFSSGGFSNYWARPAWQQAAVATYLTTAKNLPSAKVSRGALGCLSLVVKAQPPPPAPLPGPCVAWLQVFNSTGAGFPDVAALSENFEIVYGGSAVPVDGTSCAAPTFAGEFGA